MLLEFGEKQIGVYIDIVVFSLWKKNEMTIFRDYRMQI